MYRIRNRFCFIFILLPSLIHAQVLVKDINPGGNSSSPSWPKNVNGTLFFGASEMNGYELWKSDGTTAGTVIIKDIYL